MLRKVESISDINRGPEHACIAKVVQHSPFQFYALPTLGRMRMRMRMMTITLRI